MSEFKNINEEAYTNRELYLLFEGFKETNRLQHLSIIESITNFHDVTNIKLDSLITQTTKTNGRVNKLEGWKSYIAGGIALFCLIGLPTMWILIQDIRLDSDLIKSHIAQTK